MYKFTEIRTQCHKVHRRNSQMKHQFFIIPPCKETNFGEITRKVKKYCNTQYSLEIHNINGHRHKEN